MSEDTVLVADATPTKHELAWSREDDDAVDNNALADDAEELVGSPRRLRWPALVALVWLCAGFGVLGLALYGDQPAHVSSPPAAATSAQPAPVTRPAPAPPFRMPQSLPPAHDERAPAPPVPPANVNAATMARFRSLLKNQGMTDSQSQKDFNPVAQRVCEDAAAGTLQRPSSYFPSAQSPGYSSPPANASELALFDAIRVFCPQYMH